MPSTLETISEAFVDAATVFSDASVGDASDSNRFADREAAISARLVDKEEEYVESLAAADAEWLEQPSVADQLNRFPSSVRLGPPETEVLNLSDKADLARLNAIQKASHTFKFATSVITHQDTQFYNGAWHTLVTHHKILYQKL
jgi:hypothetical protein